jgi:sugar lactone lactonase YvrE
LKKNPEVSLLIKILAIFGFAVMIILLAGYVFIRVRAPQLLVFSKGITEYKINVKLDSLEGARFITGLNGCENILPEDGSDGIYVSCLDGRIYELSPDLTGNFGIYKSFKAGNAVTGLAIDKQGNLIAAVCNNSLKEWRTKGGGVYRISRDLTTNERLSGDFPSMNGVCADSAGNIYFTSSNFNIFRPEGTIYRMLYKGNGMFEPPEPFISDVGLANGLYYDRYQDQIFFSNTLGGVFEFSPDENALKEVYLKLRFMEACDDLCTDVGGNVWMTDPGNSTIKMFNPGTGRLARFTIEGIGQTSSCRIRTEEGLEMLYITELKQVYSPVSEKYDGRGVLVVPARSLLKLLQPLLIKKN